MKKKVLHIFRKFLPTTATFIRNQIYYHNTYKPYVLCAEDIPTKMAIDLKLVVDVHNAVVGKFGQMVYNKFRKLTKNENKLALEYINKIKPDIIHVHYGVDMLTFSKVLETVDIPIVISFYGYDCTSFPKRFFGFGTNLLQQKVFKNVNLKAVFAMSNDMAKDLEKINCPKDLIRIHYYGSECNVFNKQRVYHEREAVNFTIISGLVEKKGHIILLQAWKQLLKITDKDISLLIIGAGEMKYKIEKFINEEKLVDVRIEEPVHYGSIRHHEILDDSDVFIHPSITASTGDKEGIPGAIIEAMASGLPVISTYHAGIPFIIENNDTGLLVEEKNVNQLSEAMALFANDYNLRQKIGSNAQKYAIDNLEITVKEIELENLYNEFI